MLDTSLAKWDGLAAEKALVALLNEKTLELLHLHVVGPNVRLEPTAASAA